MVSIKKEIIRKKAFIVARDDRGRFLALRRAVKGFNAAQAKILFKKNNTFNKDLKKESLVKVNEFTDFSKVAKIPHGVTRGQAVAFAMIKGKEFAARSFQKDVPFNQEQARQEAIERLLGILTFELTGESDPDEGALLIKMKKIEIKTAIVFYKQRR